MNVKALTYAPCHGEILLGVHIRRWTMAFPLRLEIVWLNIVAHARSLHNRSNGRRHHFVAFGG